jgi:hypothetical protein
MIMRRTPTPVASESVVIKIAFLIEHPIHGWTHLPENQGMLVQEGKLGLPEYAGKTARIAWAAVFAEGLVNKELSRLEVSVCDFDVTGSVIKTTWIENVEPYNKHVSRQSRNDDYIISKKMTVQDLINVMTALHLLDESQKDAQRR